MESGEHLDLSSQPGLPQPEAAGGRPYLGVHFACCGVYARVYRNAQQTAYTGHCPRCLRLLMVKIGPGGSDQRFFTVS